MARTWLDAVRTFQSRFIAALDSRVTDAGEQAALVTPRFCRDQRERAVVLACCRRSEFLSDATPADLRAEVETVNRECAAALARYAERAGVSLEACHLAIVAFPLGAVRLYLPGQAVPESIDAYVSAAFQSAMVLGKR